MNDIRFGVAGASHPGRKRAHNDDWFCIGHHVEQAASLSLEFSGASRFFSEYGLLCAVADGIGGYEGGARAAQVALQTLGARVYACQRDGMDADAVLRSLREDLAEVARVTEATLRREGLPDAGTTLAGLLLLPPDIAVKFWCGDSRILRESGGYVRALTLDHSPLARDVAQGILIEQAAAQSPLASKLSRSLGAGGNGEIECDAETVWEKGDRFLLCTDGFHGLGRGLSLAELRARVGRANAESLVNAAVEADGSDNATLVEVKIS